jgi:hypothetical protein
MNLAGETEVLGGNLPRRHFVHHKIPHDVIGTVPVAKRRAITQAFSRWFPTAEACVRARVRSCGFVVDKVALGQVFLRVLWFPLPIFIKPTAPQSPSSIIWGWYNRPVVAVVASRLSLTPLRRKIKKKTSVAKTT